ncbi:MAG TPA: hypothetical protein VLJ57_22250 [Burkholderiaceae bacterium]|nr:hypothetical protein [Burkholderiaceae bacterium]
MYFWRIDKLKQDLVSAPLSERHGLYYLLISMPMAAAVSLFPAEAAHAPDYVGAALDWAITVAGLLYAFVRNGGDAGRHFVQRFLAIGIVTTIRWVATIGPALIVVVVAYAYLLKRTNEEAFALFYGLWWPAEIFLWWQVGRHIRDVARAHYVKNEDGDRGVPPRS